MIQFATSMRHSAITAAFLLGCAAAQTQEDVSVGSGLATATSPLEVLLGLRIGDDLEDVRRVVAERGYLHDPLRDQVIADLSEDFALDYRRDETTGEMLASVEPNPGQSVDVFRNVRVGHTDADGTIRRLIVDVATATGKVIEVTSFTEVSASTGWLDPDAVEARLAEAIRSGPSCRDTFTRIWALNGTGTSMPPSDGMECLPILSAERETPGDVAEAILSDRPMKVFQGLTMTALSSGGSGGEPTIMRISISLRDDEARATAIRAALATVSPGRADVDF